jgi:hypothetical protein
MIDNDVELSKALCALLYSQLNLTQDRGWIYNQKVDIPNDDGMFFSVAFVRSKPFGSSLTYKNNPETNQLEEYQSLNQQETYRIDLYSRDASARQRNHEVVFALHSTACQQMQERYSFRMGYIPTSMLDVSAVEGAARLNRYSLTFRLLRAYSRTKPIEFYENFSIPPNLTVEP